MPRERVLCKKLSNQDRWGRATFKKSKKASRKQIVLWLQEKGAYGSLLSSAVQVWPDRSDRSRPELLLDLSRSPQSPLFHSRSIVMIRNIIIKSRAPLSSLNTEFATLVKQKVIWARIARTVTWLTQNLFNMILLSLGRTRWVLMLLRWSSHPMLT